MTIRFSYFAAFVIMACFVVAVFVAPYICAAHWMYPPAHRRILLPTVQTSSDTIAPVKAGATFQSFARSSSVSDWGSGLSQPGMLRSTMGREQEASAQTFGDGAAWNANTRPGWDSPLNPAQLRGIASKEGETRRAGVATGHHLQALANAAAGLCGIDPALFWSLILRESSGRHWDAQWNVLRSSSSALGLGQIKASTARGVSPHLDPFQPWDNAVASACYFRSMLDRYRGDVRRALHAYHRGPNAKGATPKASRDYAAQIMEQAND